MAESSTIIAALKFQGGVVIASDSQVSDPVVQVRWEIEKLERIGQHPIVVGMSGSLGMLSRVRQTMNATTFFHTMFQKRDRIRDAIDRCFLTVYQQIKDRNAAIPLWGLSVYWAEGGPHILEHETST